MELQNLLGELAFESARDTLVFVGDLVHKGPGSAEVLSFARRSSALCVRGNHDDALIEAWYRVGRYRDSLDAYGYRELLERVTRDDIRWLQELPLTISFPWLQVRVVHAGFVQGVDLKQQSFKDMLWMRDVRAAAGGGWQGVPKEIPGSRPWVDVWQGPEHVVFGHDAKRKLQRGAFATGLDTGCCYGNHLTALVADPWDFHRRTIVQTPAERVHTAPELKLP